MYFDSVKEFIEMGGHGFYVWLSYCIVLLTMIIYYFYTNYLSGKSEKELILFYHRIESKKQPTNNTQQSS